MKINGAEIVELSDRELQCVVSALQGSSDREIAKELDLSVNSIHAFLGRAYIKLNISRRDRPDINPRMRLYAMVQNPDSILSKQIYARLGVTI